MNPELQKCIDCKVKCKLEDMSRDLAKKLKGASDQEIRSKVSIMSQRANIIGCPGSEIKNARDRVANELDSPMLRRVNQRAFAGALKDGVHPVVSYPSGQQYSIKGKRS